LALRNIFDQYSQPENCVTHALMTAINEDRRLLDRFFRELVKVKLPTHPHKLSLVEQRFPHEAEPREDELEQRGIPDGWIFHEQEWCAFIESKVLSKLRADQIRSHQRTAERLGFRSITAIAIAPLLPRSLPAHTVSLQWKDVYTWLRRQGGDSPWAARAADYLELAEAKLIDTEQFVEGSLTIFAGFPFGRDLPFAYLEGKRVLGLALDELRKRRDLRERLGMNPKERGRPAITGRQGPQVWDFLSLSVGADGGEFTRNPHLSLVIGSQEIAAMATIPNAVNSVMRRNLKHLGEAGFHTLAKKIVDNLRPLLRAHKGATPWCSCLQRRFPSRRATPYLDARIQFDLRTAVPSRGGPKVQPRWLSAAYGSFVNKEGSNYEMQMGVLFPYERCPALELIAAAWLACKPLVDLAR
jgi:hypothetical protein